MFSVRLRHFHNISAGVIYQIQLHKISSVTLIYIFEIYEIYFYHVIIYYICKEWILYDIKFCNIQVKRKMLIKNIYILLMYLS